MKEEVYGVKCTYCGTQTANYPVWKNADSPEDGVFGTTMRWGGIQLVDCAACALTIVVDVSDRKVVWPLVAERPPKGVPPVVEEAYRDAMLSLAAGSKIGALMSMRTMGSRLLRDIGLSKFSQLAGKGVITQSQYVALDQNRLWANVFGHEDVPTGQIDLSDIAELFQFVRTILETIYTQPKIADRFAEMTKRFEQNN